MASASSRTFMKPSTVRQWSAAVQAGLALALVYGLAEILRPGLVVKDVNLLDIFSFLFVLTVALVPLEKVERKPTLFGWLVVLLLGAILLTIPDISLWTRLIAAAICVSGSVLFLRA